MQCSGLSTEVRCKEILALIEIDRHGTIREITEILITNYLILSPLSYQGYYINVKWLESLVYGCGMS